MKFCVVYNPESGRFNINLLKKNLSAFFSHHTIEYKETLRSGHATEIVSKLQSKYFDRLICVGGDGTINEIINGLKDTDPIPLAIIPFGTANVLSYDLGINSNFKNSMKALAEGFDQKIYFGIAGKKKFFSTSGVGFDAYVISRVNMSLKKKYGKTIYFYETLKAFFTYKYPQFIAIIDGKEHLVYSLIISNSKYYAGPFIISKKIDIKKNNLFVTLFLKKGTFQCIYYFILLILGKLHVSKNVKMLEFKKLQIKGKDISMHLDGDLIDFENKVVVSDNTVTIKSLE